MELSEKEKMSAGLFYNALDRELLDGRDRARKLADEFNAGDYPCRCAKMGELFARVGVDCYIEPPMHCDYGFNVSLGDHFYANYNLTILDCAPVSIGNNVMLGPNVGIYTAGHPVHPDVRRKSPDGSKSMEYALPIVIEDDVWVGGHCAILPGVTIGKGSVIGAGSVVTKDIPANVVAAGTPCKVIRPITEHDREFYAKGRKIGG